MNLWTDIRDFLFPRLCLSCGKKLLQSEDGLCISCFSSLPYTHLGNTSGNEMEKCFWGRFPVVRASSLFYYAKGGDVAQILYAMKYHARKKLCCKMGEYMAGGLCDSGFFEGIDYLLPVPLFSSRLRQRGYNQSELLARGISCVTGIPLCTDAVVRSRNNATQTHKSGYARWQNVDRLFLPTPQAANLHDKHILLVDDVLTTGATLVACADALLGVENIKISVLTLAWAR